MAAKKLMPTVSTITSTYEFLRKIGEGGSGTVYEAKEASGGSVAIKTLDPGKATAEKRKRFKNELHFGYRNQHRNIMTLIDFGTAVIEGTEVSFYVMPLYPLTLKETIKSGVSHERAKRIIPQLLDGVDAAHRKRTWHRDLKPANVVMTTDDMVVIADWGCAHFEEVELQTLIETAPNQRLASFQYAAPEQRRPGAAVDHRADIFSLGLIFNEMFTREVIQGTGHKTIASVDPTAAYLDELVDWMVRQNPAERPDSIDDVKKRLIALSNLEISRLKLDELEKVVIPTTESDDLLLRDPIRVLAGDWNNGVITFTLNRAPNIDWINVFRSINYHIALWDKEPATFQFNGSTAINSIDANQAQDLIGHFKRYIEITNNEYARQVKATLKSEEDRLREHLRRQKAAEVQRQELLKRLQF